MRTGRIVTAPGALLIVGVLLAGCSSDTDTTEITEQVQRSGATLVSGTTNVTVSERTGSERTGSVTEEIVSDDPRVAGTAEGTWEAARWEAADTLVQWGTSELTNEDGSWQGDYAGIRTAATGDVLARWWDGAGAYEGLTFFMWITDSSASPWQWIGVVFPGAGPLTSERNADLAPGLVTEASATLVSGTFGFEVDGGTSTASGDGSGSTWRNWVFTEEVTADDERVAGVMEGTWSADVRAPQTSPETYTQVQWGTATLTNDGGSWEGVYSAMFEREHGDVRVQWWTGSGDYEGLTLFTWATADPTARRRSGSPTSAATYEWTGLIYPGTPPFAWAPAAGAGD